MSAAAQASRCCAGILALGGAVVTLSSRVGGSDTSTGAVVATRVDLVNTAIPDRLVLGGIATNGAVGCSVDGTADGLSKT